VAGIRVFTIALTIVMFAAIGVSMATGDLGDEGSWILDHAWGRMSLIDLYVGIALSRRMGVPSRTILVGGSGLAAGLCRDGQRRYRALRRNRLASQQ